jgi:hypothetical protein
MLEGARRRIRLTLTLFVSTVMEPANRVRVCAATLSVLLHVTLLVAVLMARVHMSNRTEDAPEFEMQLSLLDDRDTQPRHALPEVQPPTLQEPTVEELSAAVPREHSPELKPLPETAASAPKPAQPKEANETSSVGETARTETTSPETAAVMTTEADSALQLPTPVEAPKSDTESIAMPTTQQAKLTRRVIQWVESFKDNDPAHAQVSWQDEGRQYSADLTRQPAVDSMGIEHVIVEVETQEDGKRLQTRLELKRLAFSHFAQLVDQWDEHVQLHDDEIDGRFHSNSTFNLGYDRRVAPRFLGKVTTNARGYVMMNSTGRLTRDQIFVGGVESSAARIPFPKRLQIPGPNQAADATNVVSFGHDTRITFHPNGTYCTKELSSRKREECQVIATNPAYFVAERRTCLHVLGKLAGTVLIYSPGCIVIDGNVVYAHDPRRGAEVADYLGLVSDGYVEIAPPGTTGHGDVHVDAAIYARERFVITEEEYEEDATLFIYGSLTAGSITASEPRYATRIEFDPRFEHMRPPNFPMTNHYEVENWDQSWEATPEETP